MMFDVHIYSGVDCFKEQFDLLEGHYDKGGKNVLHPRRYASLPRLVDPDIKDFILKSLLVVSDKVCLLK